MDTLEKIKDTVQALVKEVAELLPKEQDGVATHLITDRDRGHFLVYQVGHRGYHWVYGALVHIDVFPDGKIWVQHDGTNLNIAEDLVKKGIPREQIVIGWQHPQVRKTMEGFAAA